MQERRNSIANALELCFSFTNPSIWQCYIHSVISAQPMGSQHHDDVIKWNIFRVTGPLCGEFTGHRWIPLTKASDVELWCFLWSAPWINGWVNNPEAGDLRRRRTHYDVIVMQTMGSQHGSSLRLPDYGSLLYRKFGTTLYIIRILCMMHSRYVAVWCR